MSVLPSPPTPLPEERGASGSESPVTFFAHCPTVPIRAYYPLSTPPYGVSGVHPSPRWGGGFPAKCGRRCGRDAPQRPCPTRTIRHDPAPSTLTAISKSHHRRVCPLLTLHGNDADRHCSANSAEQVGSENIMPARKRGQSSAMLPTIRGGSTTRDVIRLLGAELHERHAFAGLPNIELSACPAKASQSPFSPG